MRSLLFLLALPLQRHQFSPESGYEERKRRERDSKLKDAKREKSAPTCVAVAVQQPLLAN